MSIENTQDNQEKLTKMAEKQTKEIYAMLPYYHGVVILGESITESILDYRLLRSNNVIAKRNRCIDQIEGDIIIALSLQPSVLFMEYGKNDIFHFYGDESLFIKQYMKKISYIREYSPKTKIFINSLIPMREDIMKQMGNQNNYQRFNKALKKMCKTCHLTYVDNTKLMKWNDDVYEYDGIHPKYPYYPKWLKNMIRAAKLKPNSIK